MDNRNVSCRDYICIEIIAVKFHLHLFIIYAYMGFYVDTNLYFSDTEVNTE